MLINLSATICAVFPLIPVSISSKIIVSISSSPASIDLIASIILDNSPPGATFAKDFTSSPGFVEIKNSNIDDGTKISHLTYIGDSDVGKNVNFGCGTVTCNYDGKKKFRSKIGDNSFIGCNTNLVSPVEVGDRVYIAAGSTITEDIPDGSLSIARTRQTNKPGWADKNQKY